MDVSPLAPKTFADLPPISGVRMAAGAAGVKYKGRNDVLLMTFDDGRGNGATVAGVFTRSKCSSAPVDWCRAALVGGRARALLCNSGNANAFNGIAGERSVQRTVAEVVKHLGCEPTDVFVASTGVIGEPLPDERISAKIGELAASQGGDNWMGAAQAIMTTDTFAKVATRTATVDGVQVTLNGIAKGSGMIAPDMATMFGFIYTDAAISADVLQSLLAKASDKSFNSITVDSDTSTSDTVMAFATGCAAHDLITSVTDKRLVDFKKRLQAICTDLAHQVVRDGEGASKFITIEVSGAASAGAAKRIGLAIANSPLVKTAIAGEDANWGRIVMAVGKAGEKVDRDKLDISVGGVQLTAMGGVAPGYDETPVAAHMKGEEILIQVDVGVGRGKATVWTCDLTHGYITINADYRS